jgi:hypothetical protein
MDARFLDNLNHEAAVVFYALPDGNLYLHDGARAIPKATESVSRAD